MKTKHVITFLIEKYVTNLRPVIKVVAQAAVASQQRSEELKLIKMNVVELKEQSWEDNDITRTVTDLKRNYLKRQPCQQKLKQ